MDRLDISPEQQTLIDNFKDAEGSTFDPEIAGGSNLIEGDDIEADHQYKMRVIAGQWGCVACLVPEWGNAILPINIIDFVTDRAGPNGETMPIWLPPEEPPEEPPHVEHYDAGGKAGTP